MKIFGVSLVTLALIAAAYYFGRKGTFAALTSKIGV